ncbi:MAG: MFS transporter [Myxococcota bacterium]|nr:MFS transporter [Myxococcota bacterium]
MTTAAPTHSQAFRTRRFLNWFPLGLAYAFLYMGRYNLTVFKRVVPDDVMTKQEFGAIFAAGAIVYGFGFLVTGPLVDRFGGRRGMLIGTAGAIFMNAGIGVALLGTQQWGWELALLPVVTALFCGNMFFQSFGAISIVTVKAPWFHVRERGTFSTIFSCMISLGILFAFDWGGAIADATAPKIGELTIMAKFFHAILPLGDGGIDQRYFMFFTPAFMLTLMWIAMFFLLRDNPSEAGFDDFDTGEEALSDDGERLPLGTLIKKIFSHPIIIIIIGIEFCSGIMRNGVMHWYRMYAKAVGSTDNIVYEHWGLVLCVAGIVGGILCGWCSDKFFQSRRAPMAAVLYGTMLIFTVVMYFTVSGGPWLPISAVIMSMAVIGVHGILSGTATVDFGGSKNGGTVVGIVDGFVYLGAAIQSVSIGALAPVGEAAKNADNWSNWPLFLMPWAFVGCLLAAKIWNAAPKKKGG